MSLEVTLSNLYRDKRWSDFREQIFEFDGYACVKCGRVRPEVILQVHHKQYQSGKAPWEYPTGLCETLCKGCHAREHGEIRPSDGWDFIYEEDLGDLFGECDCCGTSIRYVFHIHHEHWEPIGVGTDCCDKLTGTDEATQFRKNLDRQRDRKKRFLCSKRWRLTKWGWVIRQGQRKIEIISDRDKFRIYIDDVKGKKLFESIEQAKGFAFELIENGKAENYLLIRSLRNQNSWER